MAKIKDELILQKEKKLYDELVFEEIANDTRDYATNKYGRNLEDWDEEIYD